MTTHVHPPTHPPTHSRVQIPVMAKARIGHFVEAQVSVSVSMVTPMYMCVGARVYAICRVAFSIYLSSESYLIHKT